MVLGVSDFCPIVCALSSDVETIYFFEEKRGALFKFRVYQVEAVFESYTRVLISERIISVFFLTLLLI